MKFPKISIITVSYNSVSSLENTILSVLNQDYPNKEFIIIDGKSTDGTVNIIKKYNKDINYWISEPDKGIPDALNKGIKVSSGKWLYFLSSDDIFFDQNTLLKVSQYLTSSYGMVYGNVLLKNNQNIYDGEFDIYKILHNNISHQAQFFNKDVFDKVGLYDERFKLLSDYDLTLKIFSMPSIKIQYINLTIASFNEHGRTSLLFDQQFINDRKKLFINRFEGILTKKEAAKGFDKFLYYSFQKGHFFQGIRILVELLYYTCQLSYIKASYDNLKKYFKA